MDWGELSLVWIYGGVQHFDLSGLLSRPRSRPAWFFGLEILAIGREKQNQSWRWIAHLYPDNKFEVFTLST